MKIFVPKVFAAYSKARSRARQLIDRYRPDIFVCGHSHILKVQYDKTLNMLHINPGAAGMYGFHKVRTAIRLTIDGEDMRDMGILELPRG